MKAFEVMATLNDKKQLLLDENLDIDTPSRVKVILLVSEENEKVVIPKIGNLIKGLVAAAVVSSGQLLPSQATQSRISKVTTPRVIVFDFFAYGERAQDKSEDPLMLLHSYDSDGRDEAEHGNVVSNIIKSQTGINPTRIDLNKVDHTEAIPSVLNGLLRNHKNLTGTYINFSIGFSSVLEEDPNQIHKLLLKVADRGAKIFIAAGNQDLNPLTLSGLSKHPRIFVCSASEGIIGKKEITTPIARFVKNPHADCIANGVLSANVTPKGVDINHDGKIDLPLSSLSNSPHSQLIGRHIKELEAKEAYKKLSMFKAETIRDNPVPSDIFREINTTKERHKLVSIGKILAHLTRSDNPADQKLLSLFRSSMLDIKEPYRSYLMIGPSLLFMQTSGSYGSWTVYQAGKDGRISYLPVGRQKATSWATPNALSRELNRDFGHIGTSQ